MLKEFHDWIGARAPGKSGRGNLFVTRPETAEAARQNLCSRSSFMMNDITNTMNGMGWGISLITLLVVCALVLGIVALIKYLSR